MDYRKNVKKLYIIIFFHNLIPAYVIERLFWEQRGMTVLMVVLCEIIYAITMVIFEIPTGIWADKVSRKALLVTGAVLSTLEFIILLFACHFWIFAFVVFLAGIAGACTSGALNALLYDSLAEVKEEKYFVKIIGRIHSLDFIGALIAALSGSVLAKYFGFELNYILSAVSMLIALSLTLNLKEPPRRTQQAENHDKTVLFKDYMILSIAFYRNNTKLVLMMIHAMAIGACITYLDEFWQLYLNEIGFSLLLFGLFSSLISIARIPGNLMAGYLTNYVKEETIILFVLGITTIGFLIAVIFQGMIGILMLILIFLASGVVEPVVTGYLHHNASSKIRATLESFQSLVESSIIFIVGIGFGIISSKASVISGFFFLGIVSCIFFLYFLKRNIKHCAR